MLLKYFLLCVISEQFKCRKALCMRDSQLKAQIICVDKLLMPHFIPKWNDSIGISVFIRNEKFAMADSTRKSVVLNN